jgi:hypothetical protein
MTGKPSTVFEARAYEYSGLDPAAPLDQFSSATGTGATTVNPVAGTGFTGRPTTNAGNTLGEDKTVTVTGSYNATETIGTKSINSGSKTTTVASELIFGLGNYNYKQQTRLVHGHGDVQGCCAESYTDPDTHPNSDTYTHAYPYTNSVANAESDTDTNTNTNSVANAKSHSNSYAYPDSNTNSNSNSNSYTYTESWWNYPY